MLHGITIALVMDLTASAMYTKHEEVIKEPYIFKDKENHLLLVHFHNQFQGILGYTMSKNAENYSSQSPSDIFNSP